MTTKISFGAERFALLSPSVSSVSWNLNPLFLSVSSNPDSYETHTQKSKRAFTAGKQSSCENDGGITYSRRESSYISLSLSRRSKRRPQTRVKVLRSRGSTLIPKYKNSLFLVQKRVYRKYRNIVIIVREKKAWKREHLHEEAFTFFMRVMDRRRWWTTF